MEGMRWVNGINEAGKPLVVPNSWRYPIRTGKPDVMQSMGLQSWTQLSNWTIITTSHHSLSLLLLPLFLFYYFLVVSCHDYQLSFIFSDLLYYSLSLFFFLRIYLTNSFLPTSRPELVMLFRASGSFCSTDESILQPTGRPIMIKCLIHLYCGKSFHHFAIARSIFWLASYWIFY